MYPALTVLESLELEHDSVLWVGGRGGMEETLVARRDIPYESIPAAGLHGVGLKKLPQNLWKLFKGFLSSCGILTKFKPDVLFFTGGYLAFPMSIAALRRPSLLFVPDIEPGLALKALARFSNKIALTSEVSKHFFPKQSKLTVTGYPVRPGLMRWSRAEALDYFGFTASIPTLTITGGSKGARSINMAVLKILPQLLEKMQVIHLSGMLDWETVDANAQKLSDVQTKRYQAFPYLHEMGAALAAADLIVSRAGASTLGEYPAFGLPAILVPYPHAWRYQQVNAQYLADHGAAEILQDEDLKDDLYDRIDRLISNAEALKRMGHAMSSLATPQAAKKIAHLIYDLAGTSDGGERV